MQKIKLNIGGMTCINCQNKIERALCALPSVHARVSYEKGVAEIEYNSQDTSLNTIKKTITDLDYEVIEDADKPSPWNAVVRTASIIVIMIGAFIILMHFGVLNLLTPNRLADSSMGYGMLFVIGLITSVHCIAMCGGINLSQCLPVPVPAPRGDDEIHENSFHSRARAFLPSALYNAGRVVSYTLVGFILGAVGMLIGAGGGGVSTVLQGALKIVAGLFMVIMGLNMLNIFPWMKKLSVRMPKIFTRKINEGKARNSRPFAVGLLNGLMPCGPLQSMQIIALGSANPIVGALSMFLFSLGTVPLMLGLGTIVSALGKRFSKAVMNVGAALVVILGLAMLSQGGSLSGFLLPDRLIFLIIALGIIGVVSLLPFSRKLAKAAALTVTCALILTAAAVASKLYAGPVTESMMLPQVIDGTQVIESTLEPGSYPTITVRAGVPVRWTIDAPDGSINGCNYRVIIHDYDIEHTFTDGENVIEFTPEHAGTVRYTCWMGMIQGSIIVVDD